MASNAAMLDNLFEGRFILGIGAGVLRSDAEALGHGDEAVDRILERLLEIRMRPRRLLRARSKSGKRSSTCSSISMILSCVSATSR